MAEGVGSQGDYTVGQQASDVAAVLDYVREKAAKLRVDTQQLSIIGHSLGGFMALRATSRDKEINCVVGLAAANFGEFASSSEEEKQGFAAYTDQLFMLNNLKRSDKEAIYTIIRSMYNKKQPAESTK